MSATSPTPYKDMFLDAVNLRMKDASDTFGNAWEICKITHRGTWQAYQNETALVKAANDHAGKTPADADKRRTDAAEKFNRLVQERVTSAGGVNFPQAWTEITREQPKLYREMYGDFGN